MPNRDIIVLPEVDALKAVMTLNPTDIEYMVMDQDRDLQSLHENTTIKPWMMMLLQEKAGVMELQLETGKYRLTRFGSIFLTMICSSGHHNFVKNLSEEEMGLMQQKIEEKTEETTYHG
jgi:hypothetical protein